MKSIIMKKKLTVKDLQDLKGKKQFVLILVKNVEEAKAVEKVGIEIEKRELDSFLNNLEKR